jgi:peroxiredoxin
LRAYQSVLDGIEARGAELVAVSPQLPDGSLAWYVEQGLSFEVLSDVGNTVAERYGLLWRLPPSIVDGLRATGRDLDETNGPGGWALPIPGTFVVDRDGTVRLAYVEPDYRQRLEPGDLLAALDSL